MNNQTRATLKKEFLAFRRTFKIFILAAVIIGWSILSPLLIVGLGALVDSMSDIYAQMGLDVSELTEEITSTASIGVTSQVSDIASIGLIVYLLVIASFAGGEQRKRSIIIPQSAGLRSFSYITPKFIIYPLSIFILSIIGTLAASAVSIVAFSYNDLVLTNILKAGLLLGVYNMFYVCIHLALGTGTGKPWISSAVCIAAILLLPGIFTFANAAPAFNPFTINTAAASAVFGNVVVADIVTGIVVAFVLMLILYGIAIFVQNAKKIDNSGNEILI